MDKPSATTAPAKQVAFSVPRWLADMTGIAGWVVDHTRTRNGAEFVAAYSAPDQALAQVTLRPLPVGRNQRWELRADLAGRQERIVIPARTHLEW
jgi:hypothetical protein